MEGPRTPSSSWPLVGRAAELGQVRHLLQTLNPAIVLAGKAGVGKTRLATECLDIAASLGYSTLRVSATQGAAGLPFGAFSWLVPELVPGTDRRNVLRQVAEAVVNSGQGKPVAIMVDDAHLLDDSSAALTHLLATSGRACVLTTLRSGEPASDPIVALWKDGIAERFDVQPLTESDISGLLTAVLGGPIDGATAHFFLERTEGNPLFVRELVLAGLESGGLRNDGGIWRLGGALPTSSRLVEIIENRLGQLDPPTREALEVLALGEPLEVQFLLRDRPELDLNRLEVSGLVHVDSSDRRLTVRLHHPLYGEVLRARLSEIRRRSIAHSLAAAIQSTGSRRREDVLRLGTWQLEGGESFRPELMLAAATDARNRNDYQLAERLARAAVGAGAGFEARLLLAQLLWHQGRGDEAERQLAALQPEASTDAERATLGAARVTVLDMGMKRPEEALQVAEEAAGTISDPIYRDQIDVERARVLGRTGHHFKAVDIIRPILQRAKGRTLLTAAMAGGTSMPLIGRIEESLATIDQGLQAHLEMTGPPWTFTPNMLAGFQVFALWNAGRLAEGWALGSRQYDEAVRAKALDAQAFISSFLAAIALSQGRVKTAERLSRQSTALSRQIGIPMMIRNSLFVTAHALALQDETVQANAALAEIDMLKMSPQVIMGPEVLRSRAWTRAAEGNLDEAAALLANAIGMARDGGAITLEASALHDLVRLGQPSRVTPRLQELAGLIEGPLAPAQAMHAVALGCSNPGLLEEVSRSFESIGALLFAAEAAADAAVAWRQEWESRAATAAERRSASLAAKCEGARTPSLTTAVQVRATLTPRELEVARMAAKGLSNKVIAQRLYISYRTVENMLHSAYEKLGVQGRSELERAIAGH